MIVQVFLASYFWKQSIGLVIVFALIFYLQYLGPLSPKPTQCEIEANIHTFVTVNFLFYVLISY